MTWRNRADRSRIDGQHSRTPRGGVELVPADDLDGWRDQWDLLVLSAPVPSPFLRSWWLEAVADRSPRYLLVVDDDVLIGGLALAGPRRSVGVPIYRFAGAGVLCPDHLDVLTAPDRSAIVTQMLAAWFNRPGSRLVDLSGVAEQSTLAETFSPSEQTLVDVAPWESLSPDSADGYLATRSANFRRDIRRSRRRLAAAGIRHRRATSQTVEPALEAFHDLQRPRPGRGALLAEFPRLAAAVTAGVACGEARVDVLESEECTVAVCISFTVAGRLSMYQNARAVAPRFSSAATVLHLAVIEDAAVAGCREVDLLRGLEPYKESYASRRRKVMRVRAAHGGFARLMLRLWLCWDRVRPVLGRLRRQLRSPRRWLGRAGVNPPTNR